MSDTHTYQRGSGLQRRRLAWTAGIGLVVGPLLAGWMVLPTAAATPVDKVVICHATSSVSNPYISTQIDVSSVDEEGNRFLNGHGDHIGPVFDPDDPQDDWGDIIPAFTNPDTGTPFPGLNWPEGQAIWEAGCMIPSPSPTETSPTPTETSPTPTETSPTPTETSPTPTETSMTPSPGETVTVTVTATATVTATQVIVVPGPGVTTTVTATPTPTETSPTPTETTLTPSPGTTSATPTSATPTPTETTVTPSPGTTSATPSPSDDTTITVAPSPGVTTATGLPTGVAAGGGPYVGVGPFGADDPLRPALLWLASAGLTAIGLIALLRLRFARS